MIGFALLAIGLLISVGSWNGILAWQGETLSGAILDYVVPHNRILFPTKFDVFEVPDYLLRYLIVGVFIASVGITIVVPPLLKRFAGIDNEST